MNSIIVVNDRHWCVNADVVERSRVYQSSKSYLSTSNN
jgi:hypothetical protein